MEQPLYTGPMTPFITRGPGHWSKTTTVWSLDHRGGSGSPWPLHRSGVRRCPDEPPECGDSSWRSFVFLGWWKLWGFRWKLQDLTLCKILSMTYIPYISRLPLKTIHASLFYWKALTKRKSIKREMLIIGPYFFTHETFQTMATTWRIIRVRW